VPTDVERKGHRVVKGLERGDAYARLKIKVLEAEGAEEKKSYLRRKILERSTGIERRRPNDTSGSGEDERVATNS